MPNQVEFAMNVSVKKIIAKEWLILIIAIIIGVVIIFVASQIYDYSHNQYYQHLFDNLKDNDVIKQVSFKHEIDNEWQLYLISPYVFFQFIRFTSWAIRFIKSQNDKVYKKI